MNPRMNKLLKKKKKEETNVDQPKTEEAKE